MKQLDLNDKEVSAEIAEPTTRDVIKEADQEIAEKTNHQLVEECTALLDVGIVDDATMIEFGKRIPELQAEEKKADKLRVAFMKPVKVELTDLKKKADKAKALHTESKNLGTQAENKFKNFMLKLKEVRLKLAGKYNEEIERKQALAAEAERQRREQAEAEAKAKAEAEAKAAEEKAKAEEVHAKKRTLFSDEPEEVKPVGVAAAEVAASIMHDTQETVDDLPYSFGEAVVPVNEGDDVVLPGAFADVVNQPPVTLVDHEPVATSVQTEHGTTYQKKELTATIIDGDKVPDQYKEVTVKYKMNLLKAAYRGGLKHIDGVLFEEKNVIASRTA